MEKILLTLKSWYSFYDQHCVSLQTVYRLTLLAVPWLRICIMKARARLVRQAEVEDICRKVRLADWFILYQLGKNMDPMIFREFMEKLHKRMLEKVPLGSM